jgi:hypothetical protein
MIANSAASLFSGAFDSGVTPAAFVKSMREKNELIMV